MADQPYQTAEVLPYGTDRRLRPPESLPDAARRAFVEVVSSHTAGHFRAI
jgi:hypothetical protein